MFIPIATDRPRRHEPVVTISLIVLTVVAYVATGLTGAAPPGEMSEISRKFALFWSPSQPWRFVTYLFLHDGFWHIAGNMLFLWVFGPSVEDRFGKVGFLAFYFIAGAIAGLAHVATSQHPVIGASGAISAVTGAYLVLFPRTSVRVLILFFIIGVWNIPAVWFIGFAVFRDLLSQAAGGGNIAHAAHLGGYAWGIGLSALLLATRILKREEYDLIALWNHGSRRRELRRVVRESEDRRSARVRPVPDRRARPEPASIPDQAATLRADITRLVGAREWTAAAASYRLLDSSFGAIPGAATLGRRTQLDLANALFERGEHALASIAYQRFLEGFPSDPEAPRVRLILSLLLVRYLNDPARALTLLRQTRDSIHDPEQLALADSLLQEAARAGGNAA